MVLFCHESKNNLTLKLHVQPNARKTEIVGIHGDYLKIKVAAPPVDGKANQEIINYFAKLLHLAKSRFEFKLGETSKQKLLVIESYSEAELTALLIEKNLLTIKLG